MKTDIIAGEIKNEILDVTELFGLEPSNIGGIALLMTNYPDKPHFIKRKNSYYELASELGRYLIYDKIWRMNEEVIAAGLSGKIKNIDYLEIEPKEKIFIFDLNFHEFVLLDGNYYKFDGYIENFSFFKAYRKNS